MKRQCDITLAPEGNQQRRDVCETQDNNQEQRGFSANTGFVPNQGRLGIHFIESHG